MPDVPTRESDSGYLRVAPDTEPAAGDDPSKAAPPFELDFADHAEPVPTAPAARKPGMPMTVTHGPGREPGAAPRPSALLTGLAVLLLGTALATVPIESWATAMTFLTQGPTAVEDATSATPSTAPPAGQSLPDLEPPHRLLSGATRFLASEAGRWIVAGLLIVAALSVLRARAFAVVVTGGLFALTILCCDALLAGRLARSVGAWLGEGAPLYALPLASASFGYLVHAVPANSKISVRGTIGLVLVAAASFGTIHGWYDWTPLASRVGPTASQLLSEWTAESTWATVLILTAIGVASSRTRPIHLLIALMLIALAWHCISSGLIQLRSFPELAVRDYVPTVEDVNYRNVEAWRWVVAVELALLAAILLHLSLGMGALNVAFAITWMIAGMGVYGTVGNMSLLQTFSAGYSAAWSTAPPGSTAHPHTGDPLSNWGLPIGPPPQTATPPAVAPPVEAGETPTPPSMDTRDAGPDESQSVGITSPVDQHELDQARLRALASIQRPATIREVTPLVWMFLTAALAGLIAVTGVSMMTSSRALRRFTFCALWVALGVAGTILWFLWPKDSETWLGWLAAWRYSQHHTSAIWLTFLGSAAFFGFWALRHDARLATWVHASAAAVLLGTCLTLGAVAILIYWGGFPTLPAWIYVAIAVGQSSLMWALLMHQSFADRRARRLA